MSDKDKIYEVFRKHEHKLSTKPSRRAWERLDARLDRYDKLQQRPSWFKYGGMLAAMMILVLTISFLIMNNGGGTNLKQFVLNDSDNAKSLFASLEDLSISANNDNYLKIVAYKKEYKNRAYSGNEGSLVGDLKPRGNIKGEMLREGNFTDQSIAMNDLSMDKNSLEVIDLAKKSLSYEKDIKAGNPKEIEKINVVLDKANSIVDEERMKASKARTMNETSAKPSASKSKKIISFDDNAMLPQSSRELEEVDELALDMSEESLSDFNWLLGKWKQKSNESTQVEEWIKLSDTKYIATSKLVTNDAIVISGDMELNMTNMGTYLSIPVAVGGRSVAYRMTSNNGYTVVFTNNSASYPKKIIMTKKSDDTYSVVMKRGDVKDLKSEELDYLEKRHQMNGTDMVRTLKKDD